MALLLRPMFGHLTCSSEVWQHLSPAHVTQFTQHLPAAGTYLDGHNFCKGSWRTSLQEWEHTVPTAFPCQHQNSRCAAGPPSLPVGIIPVKSSSRYLNPQYTKLQDTGGITRFMSPLELWNADRNADTTYFSLNILTPVTLVTKGFAVQRSEC